MRILLSTILTFLVLSWSGFVQAMPERHAPISVIVQTSSNEPLQIAVYKSNREKKKSNVKAASRRKANRKKTKVKANRKKDIKRGRDKRNDKGGIIDDETQKVRDADSSSWHHGNDFHHGRRFLDYGADVPKYHQRKRSKDIYR